MQCYKFTVVSTLLMCLLIGCGGSGPEVITPQERSVLVTAMTLDGTNSQRISGQAPLTVYCLPVIFTPGISQDVVQAVAMDSGDGSGWQDVTAKWQAYVQLVIAGSAIDAERDYVQIVLDKQGQYEIQVRVEFTDGEVLFTETKKDVFPQPKVHVLPYDVDAMVEFTDPRDGRVYDILDGRVIIAFQQGLERSAVDQWVADMGLEVINDWWEVYGLGAILPAEYSVLEAVRDWPTLYPGIIDTVDPDELFDWD